MEHKTNDTYIQCLAKILVKQNENGIIFDDGYTVLSNDIIFPRPIDMKQVRIRLMDMYGETIDLHNLNFSISLEISEVMNIQLYDTYRTYLWNEPEPRAVRNTNGSSAPIAPVRHTPRVETRSPGCQHIAARHSSPAESRMGRTGQRQRSHWQDTAKLPPQLEQNASLPPR